jgi:hypothetical protein
MLPVAVNAPGDCAKAEDANAISISNRVFMATLLSKALYNTALKMPLDVTA